MKAFKLEILIIDHDGIGETGIVDALENTKFPNQCIYPDVKAIKEKDIGDWDDDHPLNQFDAECEYFYKKTFCSEEKELIRCDIDSIEFEENYVQFTVPQSVMDKGFHAGSVLIDFSGVQD